MGFSSREIVNTVNGSLKMGARRRAYYHPCEPGLHYTGCSHSEQSWDRSSELLRQSHDHIWMLVTKRKGRRNELSPTHLWKTAGSAHFCTSLYPINCSHVELGHLMSWPSPVKVPLATAIWIVFCRQLWQTWDGCAHVVLGGSLGN